MRSLLILILSAAWIFGPLSGQNFHATIYTEANGLPSGIVRHVAQDTFGLLWIATDNGLVRFDGSSFRAYAQRLPSQYGRYLAKTDSGFLYSHDAGISLIRPGLDSSVIELFWKGSIDPEDRLLYYPDQVFQRENGEVWVSQLDGRVVRISGEGSQSFFPASKAATGARTFFAETLNGNLWVAKHTGELFYYDPGRDTLQLRTTLGPINDLQADDAGLWAGGAYLYHIVLDENGQRILQQKRYPSELGAITALGLDDRRNLYLGIADTGLYFVDQRVGQPPEFIRIFGNNDPHRVDELPFKNIHRIVWNTNGQLLICSSEGLGILQQRFFESVSGLPNGNTTAIAVAENEKIFINFGDIYAVTPTEFGFEATPLPSLKQGAISALTTARGNLLVGTSTGMLLTTTQSGRLLRTVDLSERGEGIFYLTEDQKKRLWICQAPSERPIVGVGCLLPNGYLKEYGPEQGLINRILTVRETERGRIYAAGIGLDSYLYRYLPEEDAFLNLSLPFDFYVSPNFEVHDLTVDERGVIWLATTDGLLRYDMDRIRQVNLGPEFTTIEIRAVEDLPDGSIWLSTDTEGILRYQDGEHLVIREESGLPTKVMSYRALVKDRQSRLWVGSAEGVVYSLEKNPVLEKSVKPRLVTVVVDGEKQPSHDIALLRGQQLVLEVISPAFHGYRTFYRHRLEAGDWSEPSTAQQLAFEELTPGLHRIQISAKQEGSSRWSDPLILSAEVNKRWYNNRLFQLGLLAILLLGLWWIYRHRKLQYLLQINLLNNKLQVEHRQMAQREADLSEAKARIQLEQRELRMNLLSLELLRRLIAKIPPGTTWDGILQALSVDLLKLPGVVAFELATKTDGQIELEGYSDRVRGFTRATAAGDPQTSLAAYCLERSRTFNFGDLSREVPQLLSAYDGRQEGYRSAMAVPFYRGRQSAVLFLYADQANFFDDYNLRAMEVFATYLEQIN